MSPYDPETFTGEIQHPSGETLAIDRSRLVLFNLEVVRAISLGLGTPKTSHSMVKRSLRQRLATVLKIARPLAEKIGLSLEGPADQKNGLIVNHSPWQLWIRSQTGQAIRQQELTKLTTLFRKELGWPSVLVAPVYRLPNTDGTESLTSPLPHVLIIKVRKLSSDQYKSLSERLSKQYGFQEADISRFLPTGYRCFVLRDLTKQPVYRLQSAILAEEKELIEKTFLDFMPFLSPTGAYVPVDKYYPVPVRNTPYQWNLHRINALGGWNALLSPATLGANVVVAVIDDGCDLSGHPDLPPNQAFLGGVTIDYTGMQLAGGGAALQNESHGTQCAGIIAARWSTNREGIAGIAGESRILPIRLISYNDSSVSAAIGYAQLTGARVISMSFGGQTSSRLAFNGPLVRDAVRQAFQNQVVLCAATMNDGTQNFIPYPAAYPEVIACGASSDNDINEERRWPDSNYGEDVTSGGILSVVAPGVNIPTTANTGQGNSPDGNYSLDWSGTSAATPHVAALAALMICIKPRITSQQVKDLIEQSADKVPSPTLYTIAKSNGGWNPELGYGRINVANAVDRARWLP